MGVLQLRNLDGDDGSMLILVPYMNLDEPCRGIHDVGTNVLYPSCAIPLLRPQGYVL